MPKRGCGSRVISIKGIHTIVYCGRKNYIAAFAPNGNIAHHQRLGINLVIHRAVKQPAKIVGYG
jgi:hypothetical protein